MRFVDVDRLVKTLQTISCVTETKKVLGKDGRVEEIWIKERAGAITILWLFQSGAQESHLDIVGSTLGNSEFSVSEVLSQFDEDYRVKSSLLAGMWRSIGRYASLGLSALESKRSKEKALRAAASHFDKL